MADFAPAHPGEVLREEFLKPLDLSQYALAKAIGVPQIRINEIVNGKRAITPDTALRLARYFGTSAEFWIGMQATYDLEMARDQIGAKIKASVHPGQRDWAGPLFRSVVGRGAGVINPNVRPNFCSRPNSGCAGRGAPTPASYPLHVGEHVA
jgi:addiction module HigA family antidote